MLTNASATPSQQSQVAAKAPRPRPGKGRANGPLLPLAVVTAFASTPDPKKCSPAREAREKGEPARAAEGLGSMRSLPRGLEIDQERNVLRAEAAETAGKKEKSFKLPAVKSSHHHEGEPTQARIVSVCRLRRNQAGRAESFAQIERDVPALLGTAAIAL